MENLVNDGIYLHINNGGVSIGVTNENGLALEIEAGHFGNTTNKMKLFVSRDSLRRIGQMLLDASEQEDQKEVEYLSLTSMGIDKDTGKTKRFDGQKSSSFGSSSQDGEAAAVTATSKFTSDEIDEMLRLTAMNEKRKFLKPDPYTGKETEHYEEKMMSGHQPSVGHYLCLTADQYNQFFNRD